MGLVITRREGERVLIGKDIQVHILEIGRFGRQVRIKIDAPDDVAIHRSEVAERSANSCANCRHVPSRCICGTHRRRIV